MCSLKTQVAMGSMQPGCAWITVNRACNFRCSWCYAQGTGYNPSQSMTLDLAKALVSLLESLGIRDVTVIGGEPTLWKHLIEFNAFCAGRGIKTGLVTNAMRFGVDSFWERYVKAPNNHAGVSVKAFDEKSLRVVAGVARFDLSRKGIERAVKFFNCGVSTVYNTVCADNLVEIARFAMECGAKSLRISPCTPALSGRKVDGSYVVEPHALVKNVVSIYPQLHEITHGQMSFSMKLPLCLWPREFIDTLIRRNQINTVCQLQHRSGLIFDTDGRLAICNSLFDYPIGRYGKDFSDTDSLLAVVNGPDAVALYDRLTSYPSKKCIECEKFNICAGGCPLFWTLYHPEELIPGW